MHSFCVRLRIKNLKRVCCACRGIGRLALIGLASPRRRPAPSHGSRKRQRRLNASCKTIQVDLMLTTWTWFDNKSAGPGNWKGQGAGNSLLTAVLANVRMRNDTFCLLSILIFYLAFLSKYIEARNSFGIYVVPGTAARILPKFIQLVYELD